MESWCHPDIATADAKIASLTARLAGLEARRTTAGDEVPEELLEDLEITQAALGIARRRRDNLARAIAAEVLHPVAAGLFSGRQGC